MIFEWTNNKSKENKMHESQFKKWLLTLFAKSVQTVLELDFRAVKFLFFPRWDLNPHHWYTAAPFA
jgi:hypothetical protein